MNIFSRFGKVLLLCILVTLGHQVEAQELEFAITVNAPQLQIADPAIFEELETQLYELLNNRRWTNDQFEDHEKIRGNVGLTISSELSASSFTAELNIQSSRPVYGTDYETTILNHRDQSVAFSYEPGLPLRFSELEYTDNLSVVIGFYAYYILGLDYDTFSLYGGDKYFQQAQELINMLPPNVGNSRGWKTDPQRPNRNVLIENMLNPRNRPYRKALYEYHREGMDIMASNSDQAKESIVTSLKSIEKVYEDTPNSILVQNFANAKADEVTEIFTIAIRDQKNEVYRMMTRIDPKNRNKYIAIRR